MQRRRFVQTASMAALGSWAVGKGRIPDVPAGPDAAFRPNVVLIIADDMGWGDLRSHGNTAVDTPVLDRLASEGVRVDRFYVDPVCAPTRASLLTGRWHLRTGTLWVTRGFETMRSQETTLAEILKAGGYATGCFGKWHNGAHFPHHPNGQGFDAFFGFCAGHLNNYFDAKLERNQTPVRAAGYITDALTDAALSFIEANRAAPFFCYLPFNVPHAPFQVPDRYFNKYKARVLNGVLASVYGMVENMDGNVGRILDRLDALQLAEKTLVVFLSDNGPNSERYNGNFRARKGSVYEGGTRVPCFMRWKNRIKPGTRILEPAAHIDLLPTIAELCGVPVPGGLPIDGRSLVPLLDGTAAPWPDRPLFTHQCRAPGTLALAPGAVVTARHRLVVKENGHELYDLLDDPGETRNIANANPGRVDELSKAYRDWFDATTQGRGPDPLPIPVGHPRAPEVELFAPECRLSGTVAYQGEAGWANDWLTGWKDASDSARWDLDVVRPGFYDVLLRYTVSEANKGARARVESGGASVEGTVARAFDPDPMSGPDRVPRTEVPEKEWAELSLGRLRLESGSRTLVLRMVSIPGAQAPDVKSVLLRPSR